MEGTEMGRRDGERKGRGKESERKRREEEGEGGHFLATPMAGPRPPSLLTHGHDVDAH